MNVFNVSYCRLCAATLETSELIDLSVNLLLRNEIIQKLAIFSVNTVDFTDKILAETVCLICRDSVRNSFDFFEKIKNSQCILKSLNNTINGQVVYPASGVSSDLNEVKEENVLSRVKTALSDPFDDRNTNFVEDHMFKMECYSEDVWDNEVVSTNVYEASVSQISRPEKELKNPKNITKIKPKEETEFEDDRYLCTTCGKAFPSRKELQRHTSTDNNHVPRKRARATIEEKTCDICFKVFDIPAKLRYHRVKHTDRPRDYVCDVCGKAFYAKDSLKTHKIIHNPETQDCKICKKTFISLLRLRKHLKTHEVLKPFECNECQRNFRTKYQLGKHMVVHSNIFPYSCDFCKKGFRFKNVLKTHENIHTGAKPFVCTVCCMDFTNWSNCNKHMVRKHSVSLAKRVRTAHGMMPINQETLKPKEVDMETVRWGEQMTKPRKRGRKLKKKTEDPPYV